MKTYSFQLAHAVKYGTDEAIFLENLIFWISKNRANGDNFHDGRFWTYNKASAYVELFPMWNAKKIYRLIDNLCEQGVLLKGNYNDDQRDRTQWLAFADESAFLDDFQQFKKIENGSPENGNVQSEKRENTSPENGKSFTYNKHTDNKPDKISAGARAKYAPDALAETNNYHKIRSEYVKNGIDGKSVLISDVDKFFNIARDLKKSGDKRGIYEILDDKLREYVAMRNGTPNSA